MAGGTCGDANRSEELEERTHRECRTYAGTMPPTADIRPRVALETTLLVHGVPTGQGLVLARELGDIVRAAGAEPAVVGVVKGRAVVGMSEAELAEMLGGGAAGKTPKLNTATLGVALSRGQSGATTVSATMELAAGSGVRVFATGGLGGVLGKSFGPLEVTL